MQHGRTVEFILDDGRRQTKALASALDDRPAGRQLAAHEERNADDAFIADNGDLGRRAVFHDVEKRDDGRRREIHVAERAARLVQDLAQWHLDVL